MSSEAHIAPSFTNKQRIWEIDLLRGVAILLMIVFHLVFDLVEFYDFPINYRDGIIYWVGRSAAVLFMILAGISHLFTRNDYKRGLQVAGFALVITLFSYISTPALTIKFGILHFFAFCMLTTPLWRKCTTVLLAFFSLISFSAIWWLPNLIVRHDWFAIFGLRTPNFVSGDYYPVFPWLGWYLIGMILARLLYQNRESIVPSGISQTIPWTPIHWMGQYSIWIYFIHQPIILGLLWIVLA